MLKFASGMLLLSLLMLTACSTTKVQYVPQVEIKKVYPEAYLTKATPVPVLEKKALRATNGELLSWALQLKRALEEANKDKAQIEASLDRPKVGDQE